MPETTESGSRIKLDVHVVNDLRREFDEAFVDAHVGWPGGDEHFRFGGPIPADEVVMVGTVLLDAPEVPGELTLDLVLTADGVEALNHYRTVLEPSPA
jgi:hypothetical protein